MKRSSHMTLLFIGAFALVISALTGASTRAGAANRSPIRIGIVSILEGPFTVNGEDGIRGAKMALLEHGGRLRGTGPRDQVTGASVGGHAIKLYFAGSDATPDVAVEAERKLVEQNRVQISVGPASGDEGLAIKDYAKKVKNKVTVLNGGSAAVETTFTNPAPNFFRFNTDGAQWMAGLGTYVVRNLKYKKVATLGEDYAYPYSQVGGFMYDFCKAGGSVTKKIWVPLGTKDYASVIQQIPRDINALYVALGGADAINFVKQYDQFTGFKTPIIGGSSTIDPTVLQKLGKRVVGTPSAGPVAENIPLSSWKRFTAAYKKEFPDGFASPSFQAWAYYLNMKAALVGLGMVRGDLSHGQAAFRRALARLSINGPTGRIKLDKNRQAIGPNFVTRVESRGGTLVTKIVKKVPAINQTLGANPSTYRKDAPYKRNYQCH